jgi:CoA:oxalate CoA-transferase
VPTTPDRNPEGPLDGIRVLDLTRVLSGPHCARMLADLGAEVIKVEAPDGDLTRMSFPRINSIATYFTQQNCGKLNVSLDLKRPEAVALLRRLAAACDVVVENFRPGVMDRMGVGYDILQQDNPGLVYCAITGFGLTGPWKDRRAYAAVVGAESGLTMMQSAARGGVVANDPLSHADVYAGLEALAAIIAALFQRTRTGLGQLIDVSMAETMLSVNEHVHAELLDGIDARDAIVSFQPGDYPVFATADGRRAATAGHPAERGTFERYCRAVGRPELIDDPRFDAVRARKERYRELVAELQVGAGRFSDTAALERSFEDHGVAVGALRSVREVADSDWATERGAIVAVADRGGGTVRIPNAPWHFSGATTGVRGTPRYRGEDNREVLRGVLGMADDEVDRLEAAGVLVSRVPPGAM